MFTGIIEEIGAVASIRPGSRSFRITLNCSKVLTDAQMGDSIAVNGVCLTVSGLTAGSFTADVMAETLRRSSLGDLKTGSQVNLERAMLAGGRFGGHIVSGHIDGVGVINAFKKEDNAVWVTVNTSPKLLRYIVEKGSIAIDGISLTVAVVSETGFQVSVIPHTKEETTLLSKKVGSRVNLENDIIGKYVERLMQTEAQEASPAGKSTGVQSDGHTNPHGTPANSGAETSTHDRGGITMDLLSRTGFL